MKTFPNHRCNLLGIIFNTVTVQCNLIIGAPLERDLFFNQKNINEEIVLQFYPKLISKSL